MFRNSLRTFVATAVCSLPAVLLSANSALADQRDFTVHNLTNQDIYYLYVSDSNSSSWGEDVLGETRVLAPGESIFVYFDSSLNTCVYDIRAVNESGAEWDNRQINLCEITDYYIQ